LWKGESGPGGRRSAGAPGRDLENKGWEVELVVVSGETLRGLLKVFGREKFFWKFFCVKLDLSFYLIIPLSY
jgi:hypothetical protein